MLARLSLATPFAMVAPDNTEYESFEYEDEGYRIVAKPPRTSDLPFRVDVPDHVEMDGAPAFVANAFQFDFYKADFDRGENSPMDPPEEVIRRAVGSLIARLRFVTRGAKIDQVAFPRGSSWRLEYLNDDGTAVAKETGKVRARGARAWAWALTGVSPAHGARVVRQPRGEGRSHAHREAGVSWISAKGRRRAGQAWSHPCPTSGRWRLVEHSDSDGTLSGRHLGRRPAAGS
jgi:hypothetical protein